jgi:hypothetical protein
LLVKLSRLIEFASLVQGARQLRTVTPTLRRWPRAGVKARSSSLDANSFLPFVGFRRLSPRFV